MRRAVFSLLALGLLTLPPAPAPLRADEDRIIAVVNDEAITESEFNRALGPVYLQMQAALSPEELGKQLPGIRQKVLDQLVEERLMLQEAKNPRPVEVSKGKVGIPHPIEVSAEEVEEMVQEARSKFEKQEEFEEALARQNLTVDDLRARYREQITVQKLITREIRSRVNVSPAEITAYYEANQKEFITPPAVEVATILIRPKDVPDVIRAHTLAQEIRHKLDEGADFYDLAVRSSDGFNAQMGGRIGWLEQGKSRKEIDDILFKMKPGEISPIIQTPAGFHIFRVESARPSRQAELKEVQADILYKLRQQKASTRYEEWMAKLKSDSYISIP